MARSGGDDDPRRDRGRAIVMDALTSHRGLVSRPRTVSRARLGDVHLQRACVRSGRVDHVAVVLSRTATDRLPSLQVRPLDEQYRHLPRVWRTHPALPTTPAARPAVMDDGGDTGSRWLEHRVHQEGARLVRSKGAREKLERRSRPAEANSIVQYRCVGVASLYSIPHPTRCSQAASPGSVFLLDVSRHPSTHSIRSRVLLSSPPRKTF